MGEELGRNPGNLLFKMSRYFRDVPLAGRSVLDIGAGDGDSSLYAAVGGAGRVVALEPEAAGSTGGARARFDRIAERLGATQVELLADTLQSFEAKGETFDVLISIASVNHLDEDACTRLQDDEGARQTYRRIFSKLAELANPGADLIVADAARDNLFPRLGVRNPVARTIEWEKHQQPEFWATLLAEAGFADPEISWRTFNTLRRPGEILFGNRFAAYCSTSAFRLRMKYPGERGTPSGP